MPRRRPLLRHPRHDGGGRTRHRAVDRLPKLLEFEAAYCSACATMAPVVKSIVESCARGSDVVRHVDVVAREGEALARHYDVAALPTFVAVDAEGQEVFRKVGVQKPEELATLIAEVTGRDCVSKN